MSEHDLCNGEPEDCEGCQQCKGLSESAVPAGYVRLEPMHEAPRDGTEILAFYKGGGNFHPVSWVKRPWMDGDNKCWGMRWNRDYHATDDFYSGWVNYPKLRS